MIQSLWFRLWTNLRTFTQEMTEILISFSCYCLLLKSNEKGDETDSFDLTVMIRKLTQKINDEKSLWFS